MQGMQGNYRGPMRPAVSGQDKTSYTEDLKRQMLEKKRFSLGEGQWGIA